MSLNHIKEILKSLFFKGDRFLIIEILNHYVQVTALKANFEKKKIYILKNWFRDIKDFNLENIRKEVGFLLKNVKNPEKYKIVLSLDSNLATTIYSSVSLIRSNPKELIDEADLDNLISQAIWRFFDRNRLKIAQKMDIDEMEVFLSDVRIRGIKLDGHKVVNPVGFKSKTAEIYFSQTFMVRELMREFHEIIPRDKIVFITETGPAMAHVFRKVLEKDSFFIANLFPNQTSIVGVSSGRLSHLDNFGWGENNLIYLLERYFQVDPTVAKSMISTYVQNGISQDFSRRFENILNKELQTFINGLDSLIDGPSDIYLNSFFVMPPLVYSNRFRDRFQKPLKLFPLSTNSIIEKLGYDVQFKSSAAFKNFPSVILTLLEIGLLPQNDKMSHLANRRVRWLVS